MFINRTQSEGQSQSGEATKESEAELWGVRRQSAGVRLEKECDTWLAAGQETKLKNTLHLKWIPNVTNLYQKFDKSSQRETNMQETHNTKAAVAEAALNGAAAACCITDIRTEQLLKSDYHSLKFDST